MQIAMRWLVALLLVAASSSVVANDADPADLLKRMAQSLRDLDYQGSFVYQNGSRLDTLRVFHAGGAVERERMLSLSGPRNEMVRVGRGITYVKAEDAPAQMPASSAMRLVPLIPDSVGLASNPAYKLRNASADRVAGYDTVSVDIVPVDQYRYGYRIWLHAGNQLPLRVALFGGEPRPLEQLIFLSLSIGTAPDNADLSLSGRTDETVSTGDAKPLSGPSRWLVDDLPQGFQLVSRHVGPDGTPNSEQLVFGDGLASVSIYVEPTTDPVEDDVAMNRGAMNVYIHRADGWRYTSLGNVPAATVQHMALAVRSTAANAGSR